MRHLAQVLTSFDGTERANAIVARPEHYRDLGPLLKHAPSFIPRGAGLSYSAASMGSEALSVDFRRFGRILEFDPTREIVRVEAGITVGDLSNFLFERGFCLYVVPGYPDITVGGCLAFDVHGKSQSHSGNFSRYVLEFQLLHPDHGELPCSQESESELFSLTMGGMGLTGLVTTITLRVMRLPASSVSSCVVRVKDLREAAEVLQSRAKDVSCLYSWHDLNRRGSCFGAGAVYLERYVDSQSAISAPKRHADPRYRLPVPLWNRLTTRPVQLAYGSLQGRPSERTLSPRKSTFPIEGLEPYYAAFGKAGFREYQTIIPHGSWSAFVGELQTLLDRNPVPLTLASLKLFVGEERYLSFCGTGICIALDAPATRRTLQFFEQLDGLARKHHAIVNLSKDSRIRAALCEATFSGYERFRTDLRRFDPHARCKSQLRERIGV